MHSSHLSAELMSTPKVTVALDDDDDSTDTVNGEKTFDTPDFVNVTLLFRYTYYYSFFRGSFLFVDGWCTMSSSSLYFLPSFALYCENVRQ